MKHIYMFENTATKTFYSWEFRNEDPSTYFKFLHDFVIIKPDQAREQLLHFCKVHYVGQFDELTGSVSYDPSDQVYDVMSDFDQLDALRRQANAAGI